MAITPEEFVKKWGLSELKERSGSQEHFIDLCRLLNEPTPAEADPKGEYYCFERGAQKDGGGDGWADVWKRGCFAWEYKGKHADLDEALVQLQKYTLALENPPLLIVSDMEKFRIHTRWTNSVSKTYEFQLEDLVNSTKLQKLKWAFSNPEKLKPGETRQALTKRAAETFASLAQGLRGRNYDPQKVAHFVNRLIFCMFAEDIGLLPDYMFTKMLKDVRHQPEKFVEWIGDLFRAMESGGRVGFVELAWFNGGLFDDDEVLPMTQPDIEKVLEAAMLDWSEIDPSIFGTLFERGLDPDKRSQLGAHYTDLDKIMRIINPVIYRPWIDEWEATKTEIKKYLEKAEKADKKRAKNQHEKQAKQLFDQFLERLREFTVLDPACGSGNFLYLALHTLKDLEHQVQFEAEQLGFHREFPVVGPRNVKGIEINPYAAELARLSVWIGNIQWMRRNGFLMGADDKKPILEPLETIECRDAILTTDNEEPEWPEADVVIGNPPFLGDKKIRGELGDDYVRTLSKVYEELVSGMPDLVCYWFAKAGKLVSKGKIQRSGLVATNSIRGGTNRKVLDKILEDSLIFDAWSDEPWVVEGAAVRVSLVCFTKRDSKIPVFLNGVAETKINSDLTGGTLDLTLAVKLEQNKNVAFQGDIKGGQFDIPGDLARKWLCLPDNPNGRPNADVLKPWINGEDITSRSAGKWIIDFGLSMAETEAALYEAPFAYIEEHVKPRRLKDQETEDQKFWFRHWRPRPAMRNMLRDLSRCIVTPRVSKHRLFVWCDTRICPDSAVVVIARDDDTTFGILHSRFHQIWALRLGTWLGKGNDPRYTQTTTFGTFPFPEGLTPDIPSANYAMNKHAIAIAEAARQLVELRDCWLNPPEWVEWVDEPISGYPKRLVPLNKSAENELKKRTLTDLYNSPPRWLLNAHANIDVAVADAYGWLNDISDEEVLRRLLRLNLIRGS